MTTTIGRNQGTHAQLALFSALLLVTLAGTATAQQVLKFKPVPRESVSHIERIRVVRHPAAVDSEIPEADTPDSPDQPDAPIPPNPPVNVDRSGSIMRIGSDIVVGKDEVIEGDLSSVSGDITIEGHVEGDVVAMKGDVMLKSTARVDGDVVCLGGTLSEEPGAEVGGQKVTAPVHGFWRDRMRHETHTSHDEEHIASSIVWLLVMLFFGWVFCHFLEARTLRALDTVRREPGLSLGIGSLVWALIIPSVIALALVVALLCITIIGIPLALAALVGYVLFLAVLCVWGFIVGAAFLGGGLSKTRTPVASVATNPESPASPPTLMRSMLIGVSALIGAGIFGHLLRALGDVGPLRGLGMLIIVLHFLVSIVGMTVGAGALLRMEIVTGTFQRLWNRRRFGAAPPPPPPPPPPPSEPVPPPPPLEPTPSPAAAFQPPPVPPYPTPPVPPYPAPPPEPPPPPVT